MTLKEIIQKDHKYYMNTFGDRVPVCFAHGKGMSLWDLDGNEYHDFFSGIAVSALGHSHPAIVEAICSQAQKFIHCSNLYYIEQQANLAELIVENSCADRVFLQTAAQKQMKEQLNLPGCILPRKATAINLKS
jgi:acetylornithine/N-succinyldiaminopimelate aminotransferase